MSVVPQKRIYSSRLGFLFNTVQVKVGKSAFHKISWHFDRNNCYLKSTAATVYIVVQTLQMPCCCPA